MTPGDKLAIEVRPGGLGQTTNVVLPRTDTICTQCIIHPPTTGQTLCICVLSSNVSLSDLQQPASARNTLDQYTHAKVATFVNAGNYNGMYYGTLYTYSM